jgi:protein N-terminal methyltransferase
VTNTVLLPLFDDVVLAEPVAHFIGEAHRAAAAGEWREIPRLSGKIRDEEEAKENARRVAEWNRGRGKRVWFVQAGLQSLDPAFPARGHASEGIVGEARGGDGELGPDTPVEYDV